MERKKYILILTFICMLVSVFGQTNKTIYKAYISGNMPEWKKCMDSYKVTTNAQKLELINYQYGYIAYCISKDNREEAEEYMQKADNLLVDLKKQQYKMSMNNAYRSAFIGFKIGLSPYKAPFIGQESLNFAKESVVLDGTNYFGYIQLGNIAFYKPAMFGGSKTDAMKHYIKALGLIEKNPECLKNNWNYLNLLVTIINAYYEQKQYELAKKYCLKTLAIEPEFDWVKNQIYPKILKKLNDE
jgi:tetratricopeptide (TPR) repeat protein